MLNTESLLLVLLLATCGPPPEPPKRQPSSAPPLEAPGPFPEPDLAPGPRRRGSPAPQPLRFGSGLSRRPLQRAAPGWLQFWPIWRFFASTKSSIISVTSSSRNGSSCLSDTAGAGRFGGRGDHAASSSSSFLWSWRSSSRSSRMWGRGWGIRGAAADIIDAGGTHSDGSGLRGGRQAVTAYSGSRPSSEGGRRAGSGFGFGSGGAAGSPSGPAACSDTCHLARNGICEDGSNIAKLGRDGGVQVACDFGTDCTDCGPYRGILPTWGTESGFKGPIDFLRRKGVKVYARRVTFEPRFLFAYTDPKEDLDVSEQLERAGCMELGIVQVFRQVLSERCAPFRATATAAGGPLPAGAPPPLVVDVGSNFGYFAVYAAVLGCRVVAVEPVPRFLAFLHWSMAANGIRVTSASSGAVGAVPQQQPTAAGGGATGVAAATVVVVDRVVSAVMGQNISMAVPRRGVWGTASVSGMANNLDQDLEHITVTSARLDDIVGAEQVLLLKVDVEGYEPIVFQSGTKLLSEQRVENVLMEYSPGMPETLERYSGPGAEKPLVTMEDPPKMLLDILNHKLTVVQLPDNFAKSGYSPQLQDPIPEFQEVTPQSVMYDIVDADWFRRLSAPDAACPWPEELRQANAATWGEGCMKMPEDAHPKGLRVTHAYNTNLWASRNRSALSISGPVGLFGPEQDETKTWWSQRYTDKGVGNRACAFLPAAQLLRSRCRCSKPDVCGREEELLLKALAEGRMPRPPAPPPLSPKH